jgi:hypothetical protein
MRINSLRCLALAALSATGCYHQSLEYGAAMGPGGNEAPPVSTYNIPPTDPKGTAYVMSLGPERLPAPAGQAQDYLHVRLAVENKADDVPWQVDPNDLTVSWGGNEAVPASFAEASTGGPVLNAAKGARGSIDLYYPLPPQGEPPRVVLSWRVRRGGEAFAQSTNFERRMINEGTYSGYGYYRPYGPEITYAMGWGWWWPSYWGWWGWGWGWGYPWWRPHYGFGGRYYGGGIGGRYYVPRGGAYGGGVHGGGWRGGSVPSAPRGGGGGGGWRHGK